MNLHYHIVKLDTDGSASMPRFAVPGSRDAE